MPKQINTKLAYIYVPNLTETACFYCYQQLRLVTLQDWVDQLLHVNYILFDDMTAMEMEAYKKIMVCFQSSRGEQQQTLDENRKLRKDICAIIKLVQEAYHHNKWNISDMCLETLTVNHLLATQDCHCPESESEKVRSLSPGSTHVKPEDQEQYSESNRIPEVNPNTVLSVPSYLKAVNFSAHF